MPHLHLQFIYKFNTCKIQSLSAGFAGHVSSNMSSREPSVGEGLVSVLIMGTTFQHLWDAMKQTVRNPEKFFMVTDVTCRDQPNGAIRRTLKYIGDGAERVEGRIEEPAPISCDFDHGLLDEIHHPARAINASRVELARLT